MPRLYKAIRVCLLNQFFGFLFGLPVYILMEMRGGLPYTTEELPSFQWVLLELCVFILVEEVGFYYTHRYIVEILNSFFFDRPYCSIVFAICRLQNVQQF